MLPALKKIPSLELIAISSGSGLHAEYASKKYGFKYAAASENEILNDPQVNTVCILTRHHLHAEQVIRALQAGKHVFCEKPLATNHEQLAQIKQQLLSLENSPQLMVGFNRRFAPLTRKFFDFIKLSQEPLVSPIVSTPVISPSAIGFTTRFREVVVLSVKAVILSIF